MKPGKKKIKSGLSEVLGEASIFDGTTLAVIGGNSVTALTAVLSLTNPERQWHIQAKEVGGDDKEVVREYFNNSGFQRWKKIYGETDDVNRVQKDIRLGHSKTVENAITMLTDDGSLRGVTVCDAGYDSLRREPLSLHPFSPNSKLRLT